MKKKIGFLACESGKFLGKEVFSSIYQKYTKDFILNQNYILNWIESKEIYFTNGEVKAILERELNESYVYIFQQMADPESHRSINDNFMALMTLLDTIIRNGNAKIRIVLPQYPYCRQDRKIGYEGISAALIAKLIESFKVEQLITFDLHNSIIEGFFFQVRLINISPIPFFIKNIKEKIIFDPKKAACVAVDIGSLRKMQDFSSHLELECQVMHKSRDYQNSGKIKNYQSIDIAVRGKDLFIMDDMISTGGTLIKACQLLKDLGARDIYIFVSFPFFDKDALQKFQAAYQKNIFKKIIGTNAVSRPSQLKYEWYEEISIFSELANVISDYL